MIDSHDIVVDWHSGTWYAYHPPTGHLATGDTNVEAMERLYQLLGE